MLSQLPDGPQLISQFHIGPIGAVRSRSFDAGVEQYFWNGRAKLGVTVFDNHFSDEIEFVSPGGLAKLGVPQGILDVTPFGASVNSLATRSLGAESELQLSLGHGFTARAAYTYLDGVVRRSFSSDELLPSFNPHSPLFLSEHSLRWWGTGLSIALRMSAAFILDMRGVSWRSR